MSNASGGPLSQNSLHLQQAIVAEWVNVRLCPVRNTLLTYFFFFFFFAVWPGLGNKNTWFGLKKDPFMLTMC